MQLSIGREKITFIETDAIDDIKGACVPPPTKEEEEAELAAQSVNYQYAKKFTKFASMCKAVVACRVSPAAKAEVCKCVKQHLRKTTLCIGDGANDVAMILEAHVGVGIAGMEGSQAVNNADFALGKFRDLERLVIIHGRWAYKRLGYVCIYILYKNITFCTIFAYYAYYSGFAGQLFYDDWALAAYNTMFTAFPVFAYGFLEQDVGGQTALAYPIIYRPGQTNGVLNFPLFLRWTVEAIYHSCCVFFLTFRPVCFMTAHHGKDPSMWDAGNAAFTANVLIVTLRIAMDTKYFTWIHHLLYWVLSIGLWFTFILSYSESPPENVMFLTYYHVTYGSMMSLIGEPHFWLTIISTVFVALLPYYIYQAWDTVMTPNLTPHTPPETPLGIPTKLLPDPKGDSSILYHLRHYQEDPDKWVPPESPSGRRMRQRRPSASGPAQTQYR